MSVSEAIFTNHSSPLINSKGVPETYCILDLKTQYLYEEMASGLLYIRGNTRNASAMFSGNLAWI